VPINNNEWIDSCTRCGRRLKRLRPDLLCKYCRRVHKVRVARQQGTLGCHRKPRRCERCSAALGLANTSGMCRDCWLAEGKSIARARSEAALARVLKSRPPGWVKRLDRLGALAAAGAPLFSEGRINDVKGRQEQAHEGRRQGTTGEVVSGGHAGD
jgi:hypothetical protein